MALGVSFFTVATALHGAAALATFGVLFAYPFLYALTPRVDVRAVPAQHRVLRLVSRFLVNPGLVLVLGFGIYLATDHHQWHKFYVDWGVAVIVVTGGVVGAYLMPSEKRLAALAERDLAAEALAAGDAPAATGLSAEYRTLKRQVLLVVSLLAVTILATVYFMTAQTGA